MPPITKKIFVASRMANPMREKISEIIEQINIQSYINYKFEAYIFPKEVSVNFADDNTQNNEINQNIDNCDFFFLLATNGETLGLKSYEELKYAYDHGKPIACFIINFDNESDVEVKIKISDNQDENLETIMTNFGSRYAYHTTDSDFKKIIDNCLKSIVKGVRFKQTELNYTSYISTKPNQAFRTEPQYYRRDIDEEITNILNNSSLIVLEGQSYCGKTRAAFNLMINNEQWADHHFYIIQGDDEDALAKINAININTQQKTIYLIDDINLAVDTYDSHNSNSFLGKLKELIDVPRWEYVTVIITISGTINASASHKIYNKLFGNTDFINKIRVDFKLTKKEFNELIKRLRQEGVITTQKISYSNYTIGSLFFDEQGLKNKIANASKDGGDVFLHSLKTYFLIKNKIDCNEDIFELKDIFETVHQRVYRTNQQKDFDKSLDRARKDGLLFIEYDTNNHIMSVNTDVLFINNVEFIGNRAKAFTDLINYAATKEDNKIFQIGYWILDRNELTQEEVHELILNICKKFKAPQFSIHSLKETCNDRQLSYLDIFCKRALACQIFHNWSLLDKLNESNPLYKNTLATLLENNFKLSINQKQAIINKIFTDYGCLFSWQDLKSDIFALKKLTPYIITRELYPPEKILNLANFSNNDDYNPFEIIETDSNSFMLNQTGKVIVELFKTTKTFDEFNHVYNLIGKFDSNSKIKQTTLKYEFDKSIYNNLEYIAKNFSFSDRKKLFDFVIGIDSKKGFCGHDLSEDNSSTKVQALNKFLPLLDEHDALSAFNEMIGKNIFDKYTLPFLFKNRLLGFEQLLSIVNDEDYKDLAHFITLNQLLDKADTQSDAISCFRLMGVKDLKPENLKDESALGSYLKIKDVTAKESIEVLKAFKINNKYAEKNKCISQSTLGKIIQKPDFDFDSLYKLLFNDIANNEVIELLGLSEEEAKATRHNQYCYNFLYKKNKQLDKSTADDIFNKTPKDLIYNDEKSSIIAEYTKNRQVFLDYTGLKMFFDNQPPEFKHTEYTYNRLLYLAVKSQSDLIDIKIKNVNSLLIEAYNYFADKFPEEEVIEKMAYLYHLRLKLVTENDFDKVINYPYEGQIIEASFKGYLEHILKNEPRYANDDTFIFRILKSMRKEVNNDIYNLAQKFATINRVGITIDSLNPKTNNLSETVINHIVDTSKGIKIDECIIADYSPIKMLWWLLEKGRTTIEEAEKYRKSKNIDITQTYLNILFTKFSQTTSKYETQDALIERWKTMLRHKIVYVNNKSIYFSIQMAVAMLKTAIKIHDDKFWNWTISYLPNEMNINSPEILNLKISRLTPNPKNVKDVVDRWEKIVDLLRNHKDIVNTTNINSCLSFLHFVKMGNFDNDIKNNACTIITELWNNGISTEYKINLNILIKSNLESSNNQDCNESHYINADVRTFVYYTEKKETYKIIQDNFKNNLYYESKKDCLKDFLKNLSSTINNQLISFDEIKDDLDHIISNANKSQLEKCAKDLSINDNIKNLIISEQANRISEYLDRSRG